MGVRIERIKVNRGGPLVADFELKPEDLNLIYGRNETGKTYIVESLVSLLFKTGKKWDLRDWQLTGRVVVSGLEDDLVSFTKTSKKLDVYWEETSGLPKDFSRLLVVKAGATHLAEEPGDGVGRSLLKECLSGEGILDSVAKRISKTLRETTLQDSRIIGPHRGEIRTLERLKENLDRINSLSAEVEESYASSEIHSLRQERKRVENEIAALQKAKRHHAAAVSMRIRQLHDELKQLPLEQDLNDLESRISVHASRESELRIKSDRLEELESTSSDYRWAENACAEYHRFTGLVTSGARAILIALGLGCLAAATLLGLFGFVVGSTLLTLTSAALITLYYVGTRKALSSAGESKELERIQAEFKRRFGLQLTDRAVLQTQIDRLKERHIRATALREEIDELAGQVASLRERISEDFRTYMSVEPSLDLFECTARELRSRVAALEDASRPLELELASLGVPETQYLAEDPGLSWDASGFQALIKEQTRIENELAIETAKLESIKSRLIQETGLEDPRWENLISALRIKREDNLSEYKQITGEILAKVLLNGVIEDLRKEEDSRISEALKREELTKPLYMLTGRYNQIRNQNDVGLVVVTHDYQEFPLAAISTGAKEQTFLALRTGFASIAMEGKTAFLIFDDAFQHSDWQRREHLVAHCLGLVKIGWQVFCFTMDDHIRDLLEEAGRVLDGGFVSHIVGE